jgi:hypothetical protein
LLELGPSNQELLFGLRANPRASGHRLLAGNTTEGQRWICNILPFRKIIAVEIHSVDLVFQEVDAAAIRALEEGEIFVPKVSPTTLKYSVVVDCGFRNVARHVKPNSVYTDAEVRITIDIDDTENVVASP